MHVCARVCVFSTDLNDNFEEPPWSSGLGGRLVIQRSRVRSPLGSVLCPWERHFIPIFLTPPRCISGYQLCWGSIWRQTGVLSQGGENHRSLNATETGISSGSMGLMARKEHTSNGIAILNLPHESMNRKHTKQKILVRNSDNHL